MVSSLVETGIPELEVMDHLVELIKEQAKDLLMEEKYFLIQHVFMFKTRHSGVEIVEFFCH